ENIRVRSIIGRFLEHSRIYYFRNDLANDVWLSSADWMNRNLFRRIEVAFPILQKTLKKRSEEHTSELQSPCNLVCRLLLEHKNAVASRGDYDVTAIPPYFVTLFGPMILTVDFESFAEATRGVIVGMARGIAFAVGGVRFLV